MYQLIMTLLWFINGQGDIILIDLCRQEPTDLCMIQSNKLLSITIVCYKFCILYHYVRLKTSKELSISTEQS